MSEISIEYLYNRGGAGPAVGSPELSNHHVLAYPHMYALGVIVLTAAAFDEKRRDRYNKKIHDYYGANVPSLIPGNLPAIIGKNKASYRNPSPGACQILFEISWTGDNLFVGPAGAYREDDPSQGIDGIPVSVVNWAFPNTVSSLFGKFTSRVPNTSGETETIRLTDKVMYSIGDEFINALPKGKQPPPKQSKVGDWVVQVFTRRGRKVGTEYYPIYFPNLPEDVTNLLRDAGDDLYYAKLSLRKTGMRVSSEKRFRVSARSITGTEHGLYGRLVNKDREHSAWDSTNISSLFPNVHQA